MTQNPTDRVIALNGNGGAFVLISASTMARKVQIFECQKDDATPYAPQGIDYQKPEDGFATSAVLQPGEVLPIGNAIAELGGYSSIQGMPAQSTGDGTAVLATPYVKARSATATPTYVKVREWN